MSDDFRPPVTRHGHPGIPDPERPGRVLNPCRNENPTFLPGDKVRDKRGGPTWRIVARVPHLDDEYMTLRRVGDDSDERTVLASNLVPHLEMVAMRLEAVPNSPKLGIVPGEE